MGMKRYLIGLLSMLSVHAAMGQQAIDVHCHNILPTFKELLDRHGAALEETFPLPDWMRKRAVVRSGNTTRRAPG